MNCLATMVGVGMLICCVSCAVLFQCLRRATDRVKSKNVYGEQQRSIELGTTQRTSGLDAEMVSDFGDDGLIDDGLMTDGPMVLSEKTLSGQESILKQPSTPSLPIPLDKMRGGGGFNQSSSSVKVPSYSQTIVLSERAIVLSENNNISSKTVYSTILL